MLGKFNIGNYIEKDSLIHRLDARIKIFLTFSIMISLMFIQTFESLLFFSFMILFYTKISKITLQNLLRSIKPFTFLFVITFTVNLFSIENSATKGFSFHFFKNFSPALFQMSKLLIMICSVSLFSMTTSPLNIADAMNKILKPLKYVKIPIEEFTFILLIAMKFIPILIGEFYEIKKAQSIRGINFRGNIFSRIKNTIPIIIPLFVISFKKAHNLAIALELRNFTTPENRTEWDMSKFGKTEYLTLTIIILNLILIFLIERYNLIRFSI